MSLIRCENVSMGYEGKSVLSEINLIVNEGDYLTILGENGSGKSTLMKGLLRLKSPLSGTINYEGGLMPKQIGYLPQQTDIQRSFPASVYEVVRSGRLNQLGMKPFFTRKDREIVLQKMEWMGISHLKNRSFQELSGGQQQRVLLARAFCATHKVLLLDEPVAGLDPTVTAEMYELIERINKEEGITIIMISHDVEAATKYATHVLQLGKEKLYFGEKKEYIKSNVSLSCSKGALYA